jgi:hypothetical protein
MRATEFIIDNVEEKLKNVPSKPRNFVAKNAMKTTSGAGAHRDKKKEQKQGDFKHKNQGVAEGSYTTEKQILTRIRQIMHDRKLSGTDSNAGELNRLKQQLKDIRREQGVAEVTGDQPFDSMMKKVTKAPTAKERNAERIRQKAERQADSRKRSADVFGTSPADKLSIRKAPGVEEGSKEDDPFDQGWRTFFRRGDESDNPYAKGTPEYAQWLDGFQEGRAQPRHYESVAVPEKAPPGEKAERMVKHIKKGYAKDGGLSDKERSIAYATAWKHHNK